ncbi:MAG: polysaccharide deacetylase family protein [Chloroflexota bacterium]|nr:MAG: polysaccharide deacetylase family protein [Chloroflexota bacterium]
MRLGLCLLLALFAVGCQLSPPSTPMPGSSSVSGIVDRTREATSTVSDSLKATTTATATPSSSVTPTLVPTPAPTVAPTWPKGARELVRGDTTQPYVAITLDAGAGAEFTPTILSILREKKLQASIFLTGKWAEQNTTLVQQIVADGHEIGNHSYDHPDFTTIKPAEMIDQINRTEEIIRKATGKSTRPLFRYPFGARDEQSIATVTNLGYRSIYWTLDSGDWRDETTPESEIKTVMSYVGNGAVIVFHLNAAPTSKSLGRIIDQLRAEGFRLGKVSQLPE